MFMDITYTTSSGNHPAGKPSPSAGSLSRLLAAAVINQKFRDLLLTQPEEALRVGFQGETFQLSLEDHQRVLSIQARDLADFALQLSSRGEPCSLPCNGCWFPVNQTAAVLNAE
jgi:hypothetical protein